MRVGVGYGDSPDTESAARDAALEALSQGGRSEPCDMVLLFSTASHNADMLRRVVANVVGENTPIWGGGVVGGICNDHFGYAGDQVVLAAIWLDEARCDVVAEGGLDTHSEYEVGRSLGAKLDSLGVDSASPVLLFYDALDHNENGLRIVMATRLLQGIEESLGFLPDINGAGLQGDFLCSPTRQFAGAGVSDDSVLAFAFGGNVRVDATIMHGCRPGTGYYTVTKAEEQVILEINGTNALQFLNEILGPGLSVDDYPFFLILGVNKGEKWGEFDENNYASRLCLGIDKERGGIVMFESDMVEGTEFQIMFRTLELDYMPPRIEALFSGLGDREPVLALYINCAGRAAGYAGIDVEDAVVMQRTVANRAPLLGIYTGVEIASIQGRPRGLDWTGVFCLFSVPQ